MSGACDYDMLGLSPTDKCTGLLLTPEIPGVQMRKEPRDHRVILRRERKEDWEEKEIEGSQTGAEDERKGMVGMGLGKATEAGGGQESQLLGSGPQEQGQLRMAKEWFS